MSRPHHAAATEETAMRLRRATRCVHRWVLQQPSLRNVQATCRRCGARRTYPSVLELEYYQAVPNDEEFDASVIAPALEAALVEEEAYA